MLFSIRNHRLTHGEDGDPVPFVATPNMGGPITPTIIVLHDTAGPSAESAIRWLAKPEAKASAHVVVDFDGSVAQMVPFDRAAWHAGPSRFEGRAFGNSVNTFSIGIEIVNPGSLNAEGKAWFDKVYPQSVERTTKEHGAGRWVAYTPAQIEAVTAILKALVAAYPSIERRGEAITTHWTVSPGRKVDTNPLFPLAAVRFAVFDPPRDEPEEVAVAAVRARVEVTAPDKQPDRSAGGAAPQSEQTPAFMKPREPDKKADTAPVKAPMVRTAMQSKSLWTLLVAAVFKCVDFATTWLHDLWDLVLWAVGVLPDITAEVKTTLTSSEEVAGWFKIDWAVVSFYVVAAALAIVFIRHLNDRRELEARRAQGSPPV